MTRKSSQNDNDGHPDCLFLLPIKEVPTSVLLDPQPLSELSELQALDRIQPFQTCVLRRTTCELLISGGVEASRNTSFRLSVGQFVLVRPDDNTIRPNVAKILSFYKTKTGRGGSNCNCVRVQWMYRGEDLGAVPPAAVGEDEVFESVHCDTIDVDVIAGRCSVSSYPDWVRLTRSQRESLFRELLSLAQESPTVASNIIGGPRRSPRLKANTENDTATNGSDVEERTDKYEATKPLNEPELVCTDEEDANSVFVSHYDNSSLYLFCRRFYDPSSQRFLASKFEYELADPVEELAVMRRTDAGVDRNIDPGFDIDTATADVSSSESDPDPNQESELASLLEIEKYSNCPPDKPSSQTTKSKRPRGHARRGRGLQRRARGGGGGGVQFTLPSEIGGVERLPCREEQKAHVREFLLDVIRAAANANEDVSRSLYISGVPGTGKTATVREIVRELRQQLSAGLLPPFTVLELNAMSLADPGLVYVELYAAIAGVRGVAPSHAAQLLEHSFSEPASQAMKSNGQARKAASRRQGCPAGPRAEGVVIVVLDEMDVLLARRQKVLYDLLEWPMRPGARMALIGIANTMDLPERMLPRMGSRLGLNRLVYPPYTSDQLITILQLTLDQREFSFRPEALTLCAKKIGGISGDVRRALELCRCACEQAQSSPASTTHDGRIDITAQHMQAAARAAASDYRLIALGQLSLFERLVLVSAISLARRQGSFAVDITNSVDAVSQAARDIVTRNDEAFKAWGKPTTAELEEACWRLASQRIFVIEKAAVYRQSRIIVNVPADDCIQALQECQWCRKVLSEP